MCDFCDNNDLKHVYEPIKSLIDLKIVVCESCGLVQSEYDIDKLRDNNTFTNKETEKTNEYNFLNLSCDADYSSQRVGKKQMTQNAINMLNDLNYINSVLDICCAKGHFAEAALKMFKIDSIECIDNDPYMTKNIINPKIKIKNDKYFNIKYDKTFNLIHACHILEHEISPSRMIKYIYDNLDDNNGYMYIDVPDLQCIDKTINIDEFFYDKHFYYFNSPILIKYCSNNGFDLVKSKNINGCINLLFKKNPNKEIIPLVNVYSNVEDTLRVIEHYKKSITSCRQKSFEVTKMINNLTSNKKCVFYGCGRMLDYFYKYCSINLKNVTLCDDYVENFYNLKIHKFKDIDLQNVDHIITFFRTSKLNVEHISIVDYYSTDYKK